MTGRPWPRPGRTTTNLEDLLATGLLSVLALLGAAGVLLWSAGQLAGLLAHGRWPDVPPTVALRIATGLPAHLGNPAAAWPAPARDQIPGPVPLYGALAALTVPLITVLLFAASAWSHRPEGHARRERDRSPTWARSGQIRALLVRRPTAGRVVLGRFGRRPRRLVAAEPRRSVLVVAPTQAGKTSRIVVPTVLRWTGPMLVTSVKADVLRLTLGERLRRGPAYVFDPTGTLTTDQTDDLDTNIDTATGAVDAAIRQAVVRWSPLLGCATYPDAERAAAWLVEAGGDPRGENATFWEALAAKLLAPLLYAAAGTDRSLRHVAAWIDRRETTEVGEALAALGDVDALDAWAATRAREERQRDSVYATAEAILRAFASPSARAATDVTANDRGPGRVLDVDRLISGAGTLYLVAPVHEQDRLRPLFESLVQAVLRAAQDTSTRTGRPLDPALMVMLDEAANIAPLRQLATYAATGAGQGIQLCSVWQDLAQVDALYGRRAATVVNGHTARLFLAGSADLATLDATSRLIGDHQTRRASVSTGGDGGRSVSEHTADSRLAPVEYLRQLPPDDAVLLYGRAPVIRLTTTPWYADPGLRRLVDPNAAAESDRAGGARLPRGRWRDRRRHPRTAARVRRRPQPDAPPQIPSQPASATRRPAGSRPVSDPVTTTPDRPDPRNDADPRRPAMHLHDIPGVTRQVATASRPDEAIRVAGHAADVAEAASLYLAYLGPTRDMPAFLAAADTLALIRTDLDDYLDDVDGPRPPVGFVIDHADTPADLTQAESDLAKLARTLAATLTHTATLCADTGMALACSDAALDADDAADTLTRVSAP